MQSIAIYHLIYVIILDAHGFHVKFHKWRAQEQQITTVIFFMTLILWYYEYLQIKNDSLLAYVRNVTNWFDFTGQICIILYCIFMYLNIGEKDYTRQTLYSVGIYMTNGRLLFHLSVFATQFRMMLNIVVKSSFQLLNFLIIIYMLVFVMALCNFLLNDDLRISDSIAS